MTIGEYRVGVSDDTSGKEMVGQIKALAADLIDLIDAIQDDFDSTAADDIVVDPAMMRGQEVRRLKRIAMTEVEEAAMWAVKAATKKEP